MNSLDFLRASEPDAARKPHAIVVAAQAAGRFTYDAGDVE
jgi:hypothetical protein